MYIQNVGFFLTNYENILLARVLFLFIFSLIIFYLMYFYFIINMKGKIKNYKSISITINIIYNCN